MFYVVLVMGMFMPELLVLTMSPLNGLFGFLRPLFLTSKDPFKNGYLNPSIDLLQEFASGGVSWLLDSGATNHMTGSKDLVVDVHPIPSMPTHVQFYDASTSKVMGFGKVVISQDLSIEKVMHVESLAYNLLSVRRLAIMGFATFFNLDTVALLWSKTLKVAFVGYVENGLYVVNFSERPTKIANCLMAKVDVGWLWHRRLAHVNMRSLQSLIKGDHVHGLTNVSFARDRACSACIEGKLHETTHHPTTIIYS